MVVVADATTPVGEDDLAVARLVQASGVPAVLAANKADGDRGRPRGRPPVGAGPGRAPSRSAPSTDATSGTCSTGSWPSCPTTRRAQPEPEPCPTLAILGRPNVGKSTLLNRLAGEERVLVSPEPGTTRDPIDTVVDLDGERLPGRGTPPASAAPAEVDEATEFYSVAPAREVLAGADLALLVVDATQGVTHQEQRLAEEIVEAGAGLIILLNKWDATDPEQKETTEDGGDRLGFVAWAPVLRLSALTGARIQRIGAAVHEVLAARRRGSPTPELNRKIIEWQEAHPPPTRGAGGPGSCTRCRPASSRPPSSCSYAVESWPPTTSDSWRSGSGTTTSSWAPRYAW